MFRCPSCKTGISINKEEPGITCGGCGVQYPIFDGIPIIVKDRDAVERAIEDAKKSGRADWFEKPQTPQLQGPYRHHLKKRRDYVEGILDSYLKNTGANVTGLDLGCGDGMNFPWLIGRIPNLYASDYNMTRLRRASVAPGVKLVFMADVTDYPVDDDVFDVVFFNHVLEHIPDDDRALSEVRRILKPGGLIILGVPNEGAFFWRLAYKLQPITLQTSDHVNFYTAGAIKRKCKNAGLAVKEVKYIGWGAPHWGLDARIRGSKFVDDAFEALGKTFFRSQATSLYLILSKQ